MDPYLEEPHSWGGFQSTLINSVRDQLANAVSPHFFVQIEERIHIEALDVDKPRLIAPDVYVISQPPSQASHANTSMTEIVDPATIVDLLYDEEVRDRFIEIRDARGHEVVTTIEILSPFNKAKGSRGRKAFLRKRKTVMASKTHWIEIDLLRAGERPQDVTTQSAYYALLKRSGEWRYAIWHFDLRDKLPTIAVPLRLPLPEVPLNLQAAFDDAYTRAHYADGIDYSSDPPLPRLRPADANWVGERVREWQKLRQREIP